MSRYDNKFPPYTRIDLDPNDPPDDLTESSYQCECGIRWPRVKYFVPTPCCNANAGIVPHAPSMTWKESISRLLHFRFEKWYEQYNDGASEEDLFRLELAFEAADPEKLRQGIEDVINRSLAPKVVDNAS